MSPGRPTEAPRGEGKAREAIAGLVLAGGLGRRIGGHKPMRALLGRPLIMHVVDRLGPQVGRMWISARPGAKDVRGLALPVIADEEPSVGPLSGLIAGLTAAAAAGFAVLAVCPCDVPFLPRDLVARLGAVLDASSAPGIIVSSAGMAHPTIGLWRVSALAQLEEARRQGLRAMKAICREGAVLEARAEDFGWEPGAFLNINTQADIRIVELTRGASGSVDLDPGRPARPVIPMTP
ncbi:MAG: molybdenum cofactor guanylyltransferase [Bauldia sp.]